MRGLAIDIYERTRRLAEAVNSGWVPVCPCLFPDVRAPTEHHLQPLVVDVWSAPPGLCSHSLPSPRGLRAQPGVVLAQSCSWWLIQVRGDGLLGGVAGRRPLRAGSAVCG
jgi:hypothetical protein